MNNSFRSPVGDDWENLRKTLLTAEEMSDTDTKVALLGETVNARRLCGSAQKSPEEPDGGQGSPLPLGV
ncbi:MAG: hypothetical protein LBI44_04930 [Oscillospiraceae bacterium]|jgi:hypothetical protein|nr:hypothetical protein [Oscillospiraceae bacterium]